MTTDSKHEQEAAPTTGETKQPAATAADTSSAAPDTIATASVVSSQSGEDDSGAESAGTKTAEEVDVRAFQVAFGVAKSLRYHAKRRSWFENWHSLGQASAVVCATAAFASVAGQYPEVTRWIALILAGLTALDLTMGFARRADVHGSLHRRFSDLAGKIAVAATPSDADVRAWEVARLLLEADEPPPIDTLNVLCHNQEAEARGLSAEHRYQLNWWDRTFAQLISFRSTYQSESERAKVKAKTDEAGGRWQQE